MKLMLIITLLLNGCFSAEKPAVKEVPVVPKEISISGGALEKVIAICDKNKGIRRLFLSPERKVKCKNDVLYYAGKSNNL